MTAPLWVVLLMLVDSVEVRTPGGFHHVTFGMPLNWVTQDQSLETPLPYDAYVRSPRESPTSIDWLPPLVDLGVAAVALYGAWRAVEALRVRLSSE